MELTKIVHGKTCQWPNEYPLPGLDGSATDCTTPAAFLFSESGYTAHICIGHAIAELLRS